MVPCHALMSVAAIFVVDLLKKKNETDTCQLGSTKAVGRAGPEKKNKKTKHDIGTHPSATQGRHHRPTLTATFPGCTQLVASTEDCRKVKEA